MIPDAKSIITNKLYDAFVDIGKKHNIPPLDIRIKIQNKVPEGKTSRQLTYSIMNKGEYVVLSSLKEILGIGMIDLMGLEKKVGSQIENVWCNLIEEHGQDMGGEDTTDVRIAIKIDDIETKEKGVHIYAFDNGKYYDEILFETR